VGGRHATVRSAAYEETEDARDEMNDENNIGPEVQNALDERIDWIEAVVAAERKYGVRALQQAVD
jgi:hypothetical protein